MKLYLAIFLGVFTTFSAHAADCTNFSGFWKGNCVAGRENDPSFLALEQEGCEVIHFGPAPWMIGGQNSFGWSNAKGSTTRTDAFAWNATRTALQGRLALLGTAFRNNGSQSRVGNATTSMKINREGQLVLEIRGNISFSSGSRGEGQSDDVTCTYDKVAAIP